MKFYLFDANQIFTDVTEVDLEQALPPGTDLEPPVLTGTEVAQFVGTDWVILPKYPETNYEQQNKLKSEQLLQESDWVEYKSVRDTTRTPHLINGDAWDDYRVALRGIAVNPPATEVTDWPVKPDEEWSN